MIEPSTQLYNWFGLNKGLFMLINGFHAPVIDQVMMTATRLGHPALFPFYVSTVLLIMWRRPDLMPRRNVVIFAVSYVIVSMLLVPSIKVWLHFPRPLSALGTDAVVVLGRPMAGWAFPSGHSAYAVLMAASLAPGLPRKSKWALVAFAVLVCFSRITVGAHFPADVLGGAALSLTVVFGLRFFMMRMKERVPRSDG